MSKRQFRNRIGGLVVLGAFLGLVPSAWAAGSAANGLTLAKQWCASCHEVEPKAKVSDTAPPFAAIARRRDKAWVTAWLSNPHPPMEGIQLSRGQIDDVNAYLKSLEAP